MAQYANRDNADFIESLWQQYKQNPSSVSQDWQRFFEGVEFSGVASFGRALSEKELQVYELINAYRNYGHFEADLDPLANSIAPSEQLSLAKFGLTDKDLDSTFAVGKIVGLENATLREILSKLRKAYCGKLTVQCAEALPEVRDWFIHRFENDEAKPRFSQAHKESILQSLSRAETLEKFIHTRYVGAKRFSIEGAESLLPMMEWLTERGFDLGVREIMIGMAHRGRVNILANFMGKATEYIFADFNGPTETAIPLEDFDGDVKYHLGYQSERPVSGGKIKINLAFNPSHLEAVNPVVLGMTRAAQRRHKDTKERKKVVPILIHGDAAVAAQGVVLETFQLSQVKGYTVGGTVHIAIDNQVGFTTHPENARSSHYCTDVAKVLHTPVLHVNGDDVEACVRAMDLAIEYRQQWGRDIVINLICYRRYGHNEGDEPAYTQPLMYKVISQHPTVREIYQKRLISEGVASTSFCDQLVKDQMDQLQALFEKTKAQPPKIEPFKFEGFWKGLRKGKSEDFDQVWDTGCEEGLLKQIATLISECPKGFTPHPKLKKLLEYRASVAQGATEVDWGTAELLAYGSLLHEGTSIRITGQDCVRGTFSHRHAALYDVNTGEPYVALDTILGDKVEFCIYDSILSEYAVMGFEYGNAICDPTFLTIWEAQFGDFANGAQIIIDQFLSSGEAKWQQMCGLVLLLPHGYEGQGPEHSSARLERFLQLCAQNNMQVVNLTTPAQIFHAFRRQIKRPFRKPLIVMSPKSLLRHPRAVSSLTDLSKGRFQEVIPDSLLLDASKVETLALCSGKIYYELLEERENLKNQRTALVRVEQIYPTPLKEISRIIKSYPNLKNLMWVQEEPRNMGAYQFMYFRLSEMLIKEGFTKLALHYVGRGDRSSPATGSIYRHKAEQTEIIKSCFSV
jgi:2-oxoglutarate dehydrogenase E1 component